MENPDASARPRAPRACPSCGTFVVNEHGEDPDLCYLCGHAVVTHGAPREEAWRHLGCSCPVEIVVPRPMRDKLAAALGLAPAA